jgi:putative membrane protein insertion efficiency factor
MSALRRAAVAPIRLYQAVISPAIGQRCKYYPSCSDYAAQAISRFGILRGLVLAAWRLLRCNPFSSGGFDPVESQRLVRPRAPAESA